MNWKFWKKAPAPPQMVFDKTPSSGDDGFSAWERHELKEGRCPDCGKNGFFEGPSGGMSTNYMCANKECGSRFNICIAQGMFIGERISKPSPLKGTAEKNTGTMGAAE